MSTRDLSKRTADLRSTTDLLADGARFGGAASAAKVSEKAAEGARSFLSGLFMAHRTAQFHDVHNKAFDNAVTTLHQASATLYAATNGFQITFVGDTTLLNNARIRIDGATFAAIRSLRQVLETRQIGGLVMKTPPTYESSRALILLLSKSGPLSPEDLAAAGVGTLGIQQFVEDAQKVKIDRRILAVQSYAKLMLALREQFERQGQEGEAGQPRLRAVRVMQDLIELGEDRPDLILRLASNRSGHWPAEVYGVNVCLLSVALGDALGLDRSALVDLGLGALYHHLGLGKGQLERPQLSPLTRQRSLARLLGESGVSRSAAQRCVTIAELRRPAGVADQPERPHLFARIVGLASSYVQLTCGFGLSKPVRGNPIDVLSLLAADRSGRFDPDLVDLLINLLRAYPVGTEVVLDSGEHGLVTTHAGSRRWDRPVVRILAERTRNVDLMVRDGDRFPVRIVGTARFLGLESTPAHHGPVVATQPHASLLGQESHLAPPGAPPGKAKTGDLPRLTQIDADDAGQVKRLGSTDDIFREFLEDLGDG